MDPQYEEMSKSIVELVEKRKAEKDPMEKEKLKLQIDDLKNKRKALPKPEMVVQAPTSDVMNEKQVPQKLVTPEVRSSVVQPDKAAYYVAMGMKMFTRVIGSVVPYCDGAEKAIILDDLIPACDNFVQDIKSKNINVNMVLNPYTALAFTVAAPIFVTAVANYEKKTGQRLIELPFTTSSTQPSQSLDGTTSQGVQQGSSSTASLPSASSSLPSSGK